MRVVWKTRGKDELLGITGYLDHPLTAKRLIKAIRKRVRLLAQFPLLGRMIPEIGDPALREVIVGQFRVLHHVYVDRIEILRVVDGHTLLDPSSVSEAIAEYGYGFERAL
jgi:plasmid stabilization system protein ParE